MIKNIFKPENISIDDLNDFCKKTFSDRIGIKLSEITKDYLKAEMKVDERTIQPFHLLHGGASFGLAEQIGSVAANLLIDRNKFAAFGQSMFGNHLKPGKEGETVYGYVFALHIGKTSQIWEIKIENEQKQLLFSGQITMAIRPLKK